MMENKRLDVLIMTDNSIDTVGGEQESTKTILNGTKDDIEVGLLQPGILENNNSTIDYYELSEEKRLKHIIKKPTDFLKYIKNVRQIINTNNPKIIHTQSQVSFFIVALLKKTKLISKKQILIHTERGLYTKYSRFFKRLFLFFMKELNILVTTTYFNQKKWNKALEKQGIKLEYKIIENTAGFIFEELNKNLLDANKNKFTIGFSGRYTEWKNWPLAVEISKQLTDHFGEKIQVNMTVGCLDRQAEIETNIMFKEMNSFLGDRFHGEINIDMEKMNQFYYDLDVFILTSDKDTESFGRTLVEAMSRMTAVLTTDAGGSVEVVGNPNKVFNSAEDAVKKIIELYNNPKALDQEKKDNLIRVRKEYSLNNNLSKHKKMYSKIMKTYDLLGEK